MVEGFTCCAKTFGLSPVCNKEPRKGSKQGCMKELTAIESWPGRQRLEPAEQLGGWEVGRLGHFSRV